MGGEASNCSSLRRKSEAFLCRSPRGCESKQPLSVFLCAIPPTLRQGRPTAGVSGKQGSGSGVLEDLTVLQSDIMKKRINKSLMKIAITQKGPYKQ